MAINKPRVAAWLLVGVASLAFAEKSTQPSDDFLEYLGSMEDRNDNWSDFANADKSQAANDNSSSSHSSSSSSSSSHAHQPHDVTNRSKQ